MHRGAGKPAPRLYFHLCGFLIQLAPVMESPTPPPALPASATQDEKTLGIVMHVLCLVGFPILGPLVIWLIKKDSSRYLDLQGRELLNFQISYFVYALISFVLCFVFIGIPLLVIVGVASIVLTIIGIVKAAEGSVYRFPLTIRLL